MHNNWVERELRKRPRWASSQSPQESVLTSVKASPYSAASKQF